MTALANGEAKNTTAPAISLECGRYLRQVPSASSSYTTWKSTPRFSAMSLTYHSTDLPQM